MQGDSGTPHATPGLGSGNGRSIGQHLLISGILWGFSLHGWTGILHLPGVQIFCPDGEEASCPCRSFPPPQAQEIGWVGIPHSGSDGWGPVVPQSQSRASGTPQSYRGCVCSELCPHPSSPCLCLHQGCRQEPFADSKDFLHESTNLWLILLARGLGSKRGGLRSLLLLWLVEAGGCQHCQHSRTVSIPPAPCRKAKDKHV